MELVLERFNYGPTETEGALTVGSNRLYTIERPWVPGPTPGGSPFISCIPDGTYTLERWKSPTKGDSFRLSNPTLGVHKEPAGSGRYAILIHSANWAHQLMGCIAPGMERGIMSGRVAVLHSGKAMGILLSALEGSNTLVIRPAPGAKDMIGGED